MYCHLQVFLRHVMIFSNINVQTIVFWMIYFQKAQPTHDGIAIDFKIAVSSWRCRVWLSHDNAGDISWWCWYLSVLARNLRHDLCTPHHHLPIEILSCRDGILQSSSSQYHSIQEGVRDDHVESMGLY